ncbi:Uncharacterised protein [Vibrio cholerae]|nr:Uncharacterised protein [Vibrio cholerae]CSI69660.1 Uncharacterised protein [Vibrio cholerae]
MLFTSDSKVISTSPIPRSTNDVVAPRPPVSNTATLARNFFKNSSCCTWLS